MVSTPSNSQNDHVHVSAATKKKDVPANHLLRTHPTFSKSIMVSIGISGLGRTEINFIELGGKINGQYYRDVLLM